jgi:DNA adenine methylase
VPAASLRPAARSTPALTPPLKWAGGKRWLVPHLLPLWQQQPGRRLVEPLCGGLAVALGLMPERAHLNDVNPHSINFYQWLSRGLEVTVKMQNDEQAYYRIRSRFNALIANGGSDSSEAAQLFYYLNRTCYNGLCRFNSRGEFNVPFGRYKQIRYCEDFSSYSQVLSTWEFSTMDFERLELDAGDFVYADPPYDVEFTKYTKEDFGWDDQVRLAEWLTRHPGPVVLSNQATERITELYSKLGYTLQFLDAPRRISCTGDRSPALEVLALRGL